MPMYTSPDGRYLFAMETAGEGDGNSVVYDRGAPVWDRFTHERQLGEVPGPTRPPVPPIDAPRPPSSGAGIVEPITSTLVRPSWSRAKIAAMVPDATGPFVLPGYGTRLIRLTTARDGQVHPLGMSYWSAINQHAGRAELRVLVSLDQTLAVITVDKASGLVIDSAFLSFSGTGEGVYWSLQDPDWLYVPQAGGLLRVHVITHEIAVVVGAVGDTKQFHSSADGTVHSCTLNGHAAVFDHGVRRAFASPHGGYDECQIDKSGRYLLIKETLADRKPGNRIADLRTGREWAITDAQGAVGHSDMGFGYVVGEEDRSDPGGVFRLWVFLEDGPVDGGIVYSTDWTPMSRYVSHCNARPGGARGQRFLFSGSVDGDHVRANELVVVDYDGSGQCRAVCPNLNDLQANDPHGGDGQYWRKTRAAICPTGEYAAFNANLGTDRQDLFLVTL